MSAIIADYTPPQTVGITSEQSFGEQRYCPEGELHNPSAIQFEFEIKSLTLGNGTFLKLWDNPKVTLNSTSYEYEIEHWGISVPLEAATSIPREIGRCFLSLWRKSQHNILSEDETSLWANVVDRVDVVQYASDIAPPQYIEGKLLDDGAKPLILLHDGTQKRIPAAEKEKLYPVNKGEWFAAMVRFSRDLTIKSIDGVELIGDLSSSGELSEWPTTISS